MMLWTTPTMSLPPHNNDMLLDNFAQNSAGFPWPAQTQTQTQSQSLIELKQDAFGSTGGSNGVLTGENAQSYHDAGEAR
jgi:hypothetical protein